MMHTLSVGVLSKEEGGVNSISIISTFCQIRLQTIDLDKHRITPVAGGFQQLIVI